MAVNEACYPMDSARKLVIFFGSCERYSTEASGRKCDLRERRKNKTAREEREIEGEKGKARDKGKEERSGRGKE